MDDIPSIDPIIENNQRIVYLKYKRSSNKDILTRDNISHIDNHLYDLLDKGNGRKREEKETILLIYDGPIYLDREDVRFETSINFLYMHIYINYR
jgi:hypothetical protein